MHDAKNPVQSQLKNVTGVPKKKKLCNHSEYVTGTQKRYLRITNKNRGGVTSDAEAIEFVRDINVQLIKLFDSLWASADNLAAFSVDS